MRILGIDPGSLRCGFGVIEKIAGTNKFSHITHGTIILDAKKKVHERLGDLAQDLSELIKKYQPEHAVVEDVFVFKNARSALVLGQARGAVIAMLGFYNIPVSSLLPTTVKLLTAGRGQAQKFQVAHMVALELDISIPQSPDASDALALALAASVLTSCSR
jgi:crossover junction endodeoxyribonuclease RuvC